MNEKCNGLSEEERPEFWATLFEHFRWIIDKHETFSYYYLKRLENLAKFALTQLGFLVALNAVILSNLEYSNLNQILRILLPTSLGLASIFLTFIAFKASIRRKTLSVSLPDVNHLYSAINQKFRYENERFASMFETFINANSKSNNWANEHQAESTERSEQYEEIARWLLLVQVLFFSNIVIGYFALAST